MKLYKVLNEQVKKLTKIDYLILGIIILGYTILSFINLGSFSNPQTFYTFQKDEGVIFELNDLEDVIRTKLYNGIESGKYYLYVSSDNKKYDYISDINGEGAFAWNEEKVLKRVKYIKLVAKEDNLSLGEVAFYNNTKKMINIKKTTSTVVNKDKLTKSLIDEKNLIPEEISYMNSTYFDEIYFARTAYEYVNNIPTYEWTHPPLGKLIQAIPIRLFNNMSPFFYRLMGNIAGILMVGLMYLFAIRLFKKRKYAIFASLLMFFDCFHFAHTRMGTVDSFLVLFIMLSFYYMYRFTTEKENKNKNLILSGLFFGLSISVKWTGFYAGLGLAIIYLIYFIKNRKDYKKLLVKGTSFFVIIPLIIYISLYLIFPNNKLNYTNNLTSIVKQQQEMYNYHANLKSDHYFSSKWYTWPVSYKPVWYYQNEVDEYHHGTITGIGNISIWWMGIIAFIFMLYKIIRKKDMNSIFITIAMLSLFLPYIFIGRVMFLYHYFPVLPFMMLGITLLFKNITEKTKLRFIMPLYIGIVIITFIIFYPVISGTIMDNNYIEALKLLPEWYF